MKKFVIDCKTGLQASVPLTPEEVAQLEEQAAQWEAKAPERQRQAIIERLAQSDHKLSRVVEDLISALIQNGHLSLADLPDGAVETLVNRKRARDGLKNVV